MMVGGEIELTGDQLDAIAWKFFESEFAGPSYANWTVDRRLDAYLLHHGLDHVADDGSVYNRLLDRVMENISRALSKGLLNHPDRN